MLRQAVVVHMIHRPCSEDSTARCMRDGRCTKRFPNKFKEETSSKKGEYYVSYRRRSPVQSDETAMVSSIFPGKGKQYIQVDNSWVFPHSPELIRKFNCHLNAELYISKIGSIKYLFKYLCKGPTVLLLKSRPGCTRMNLLEWLRKCLLSMRFKDIKTRDTFLHRKQLGSYSLFLWSNTTRMWRGWNGISKANTKCTLRSGRKRLLL